MLANVTRQLMHNIQSLYRSHWVSLLSILNRHSRSHRLYKIVLLKSICLVDTVSQVNDTLYEWFEMISGVRQGCQNHLPLYCILVICRLLIPPISTFEKKTHARTEIFKWWTEQWYWEGNQTHSIWWASKSLDRPNYRKPGGAKHGLGGLTPNESLSPPPWNILVKNQRWICLLYTSDAADE